MKLIAKNFLLVYKLLVIISNIEMIINQFNVILYFQFWHKTAF